MRPFLLAAAAAGVALALALPAAAQTNPPTPASGTQAQSGQQAGGEAGQIRQKLKQDLEQAGFKNVQVMPESFLAGAHDKQGRPVLMVINPDSVTAITEVGGNTGAAGSAGSRAAPRGQGSSGGGRSDTAR